MSTIYAPPYLRKAARQFLPPATRRRIIRRFWWLRGKQVVHFLHIGKTGGTAVRHALWGNTTTENYAILLHGHYTTLKDIFNGDKIVFFLRDPAARFASGFRSRQRQGQPRYYFPWSLQEENAFSAFRSPNELAEALSSQNSHVRAQATDAMNSILHVNMPFTRWLESESYVLSRASDILLIGFQETLSADFIRLKSLLGLPRDFHLPTDQTEANRSPLRGGPALSETAVHNLREWYARDYEILALCQQLRSKSDLQWTERSEGAA